jgi:hypothetical protein
MIDIRQTIQYANYLSKIGWAVERGAEINYFIKKVSLVGSVIKIQRPEEIRINKIRGLAKKYRAFQTIVEPKTQLDAKYLASIRFRLSKSPYLPTKTLHLDLTGTKEELLNQLKKDARSALKKNSELKIVNYGVEDIEKFRKAWKMTIGVKRYVSPLPHLKALKKSFRKNSLFITDEDGNSGGIFLIGDKIGYYWQAFSNKGARKLQAQYKIVWEGILWAKRRGTKIFDFEGIYDERFPNKSWVGFTHFKKSFGGYVVEYPGTFVKWFL